MASVCICKVVNRCTQSQYITYTTINHQEKHVSPNIREGKIKCNCHVKHPLKREKNAKTPKHQNSKTPKLQIHHPNVLTISHDYTMARANRSSTIIRFHCLDPLTRAHRSSSHYLFPYFSDASHCSSAIKCSLGLFL